MTDFYRAKELALHLEKRAIRLYTFLSDLDIPNATSEIAVMRSKLVEIDAIIGTDVHDTGAEGAQG